MRYFSQFQQITKYLPIKYVQKIYENFTQKNSLEQIKTTSKVYVIKNVKNANEWYTKIIGLDEVKKFQDRVISFQDLLFGTQEQRRLVGKQLADVRQMSNELHDEIMKVKRKEEMSKFLELMKKENEIIQLEAHLNKSFQEYDQKERELFTAFANSIRDSHEKQRAQLEYTKYLGMVLSIFGSFLVFCFSSLRKHDLKCYLEDTMEEMRRDIKEIAEKNSKAEINTKAWEMPNKPPTPVSQPPENPFSQVNMTKPQGSSEWPYVLIALLGSIIILLLKPNS